MSKKRLVPLTILGLSLSISFCVLGGLANSHLKHDSEILLKSGITLLDKLIRNADATNQRAYLYTQKPCGDTLPFLRELVAISSDVQFINFIKEKRIYCSSLEGEVDIPLEKETFSRTLFLQEHSSFNPKESSLAFVSKYDDIIVVSSISGYYIRQVLASVIEGQHILLHIDGKIMDDQQFFEPNSISASLTLNSSNYPYSLSVKLTYHDYIEHIQDHKLLLVIYFLSYVGHFHGERIG